VKSPRRYFPKGIFPLTVNQFKSIFWSLVTTCL
jgi:hypothetical protein